ncbi:hypothetical protein AX760_25630 [Pararhizobium antarcticum]|uniref:NmrA-like domain-containing protein n=2 Tax=Pararhizobium antarcticum TaxID=1798805 RepID=A0A657M0M2_9HYPH|nr:hypothetical protein AX760_25630 [Pararhizobium antarcticum]
MTDFVELWITAAIQGAVKRIVLNVGGTPGPAEAHPFFADLHQAQHCVISSGLPYVILQPTVYLDNLAAPWAAQGLAAGMITYPADPKAEISWMSHRTLGQWVAAVAGGGCDGQTLPIGGPEPLTGAELAREIGAGLGREITYVSIPPEAFAEGMNATMGSPAGDRLAAIYARLTAEPTSMRTDPTKATDLGIELETARAFASRGLR